jgi:hypothetical protein
MPRLPEVSLAATDPRGHVQVWTSILDISGPDDALVCVRRRVARDATTRETWAAGPESSTQIEMI